MHGTEMAEQLLVGHQDRKSTRLNSSHQIISYAVFCLKKKKNKDFRLRLHALHRDVGSRIAAGAPPPPSLPSPGQRTGISPFLRTYLFHFFFFKRPGAPRDLPLFPYPTLSQ